MTFETLANGVLIVMIETLNMGIKNAMLHLSVLFSIFSGILVVISKNPIVSVLFLIGLFVGVSMYLSFLGITFIALAYLLVYVGAVSILFLFILMLINVRKSELLYDTSNSIPLAIVTVLLLYNTVHSIYSSVRLYNSNTLSSISQSACSHTTAAYCAICSLAAATAHRNAVGNCTHSWTLIYYSTMQPHYVGAYCDFNGGDHIAITSVRSVAKVCQICHALCCNGCFG